MMNLQSSKAILQLWKGNYENETLHLIKMMIKKLYKNLFTKINKSINKNFNSPTLSTSRLSAPVSLSEIETK